MKKWIFFIGMWAFTGSPICLWAQGPKLGIERSEQGVLLTWPAAGPNYIVRESVSLDGLWAPVFAPTYQDGGNNYADMGTHQVVHFLGLALGIQFAEDFSESRADRYWTFYGDVDRIIHRNFDGVYRIVSQSLRTLVWAVPEDTALYDFTGSVDILDWNSVALIGITARFQWSTGSAYAGGISFSSPSFPGRAGLWIAEYHGASVTSHAGQPWDADPAKDYRLTFRGTGPMLAVDLYELDDPDQPLLSLTAQDPTITKGQVGLYMTNYYFPSQSMSLTLDNLFLCGTTQ